MSDPELQIVESEAEAARVVAELLAAAARSGAEIALTGGSTPRQAYELTAGLEPDWSRAGVWWGDERCVPPDDERSNFRLARESLLDRIQRHVVGLKGPRGKGMLHHGVARAPELELQPLGQRGARPPLAGLAERHAAPEIVVRGSPGGG